MLSINAIGDACPLPVVKAKKALDALAKGRIEILVDNEIAVQNITRFAENAGYSIEINREGETFRLIIDKPETCAVAAVPPPSGKTVVVLSSDTMGSGDDQLGLLLMKGFVFALTQLDALPDTILLYNTGAKLSVEGSASLDDLIAMEKAGVTIMTCGTCLNHFGIADTLGVGQVTNMYSIVEAMRGAQRIVRP